MKLNELITSFSIALSNEENDVLNKIEGVTSLLTYEEREQYIIQNLIRKSLVTRLNRDGETYIVKNDMF